ncbi:PIN domain-containing protein [Limnohabitans sp. Rim8]|uniref:PIN domain-containing protein n=1 Tax=Limnohabitans sp. Rim8 TaxID=1100718 RepID=UPI003305641A
MIAAEPTPPWGQLLDLPKARCFIDTNVLVYADSTDEPLKQRIAIDLLRHLRFERLGVLSTQVLNEYIQVGLRKLGLSHAHIREQLHCYRQLDMATVTPDTIDMALDLHGKHALSYWDALIVASAHMAGCSVLIIEDMGTGEVLAGVKLLNPFT